MANLQIIIFDVEHGFCSYLQCPNGYSLIIDCGGTSDFSPVKYLKSHINHYFPIKHDNYFLTKLVVTHCHGDHVEDVENILKESPPAILTRTPLNNFNTDDIQLRKREKDDENLKIYREELDQKYTSPVINYPNWGIVKTYFSLTPDEARIIDKNKVLNNTSRVLLVEFGGRKVLFTGDLETAGWDALINKYSNSFINKVKGLDVFIAPHHGHKSAFSENLFKIIGRPCINIISKDSEEKETSDVDSRYSQEDYSQGITFKDGSLRRCLTTRNDGSIFITIENSGNLNVELRDLGSNIK
ncbi:MAG: MBL fold metallo-hydrolase [Actinobacteria bacterium]|nr:MBL fold metallo-hydrolase [Actinomycetota bacterium]